jgi:hypothetical protein
MQRLVSRPLHPFFDVLNEFRNPIRLLKKSLRTSAHWKALVCTAPMTLLLPGFLIDPQRREMVSVTLYYTLDRRTDILFAWEEADRDVAPYDSWKSYPAPHDAPRSSSMDPGCWEVKWDHRDDCIGALMVCPLIITLNSVPSLNVSLADFASGASLDRNLGSPTKFPCVRELSAYHATSRPAPLPT